MMLPLSQWVSVPSSAFNPLSVPDCILWLDAQNAGSITKDGSNRISQWNDLSSSNTPAIQGTMAAQPIYTASGINGSPAISFNGSSQLFNFSSFTTFVDLTVFVVATVAANTTNRMMIARRATALASPIALQLYIDPSERTIFEGRSDGGVLARATYASTATGTFVHIGDRSGSVFTVYRDNATPVSATAAVGTTTSPTMSIGCTYPGSTTPSLFFDSYIGEVVLYSRSLNSTERGDVYSYLKTKWGL